MVKPAELAARADFQIGPLLVSPSRRRVEGPAGSLQVEPVTMQVFLLLLDARGKVVTRDELFEAGWGGAVVGDDSLNRAINRVRRIAAQAGPGLFEIETIPRTGYRLMGDLAESHAPILANGDRDTRGQLSRRVLLGAGAAAAVAGIGGAGLWSARRFDADRRFRQLLERGEHALLYDDQETGLNALRAAVDLRPDDADAQGLLAYTQLGDSGGTRRSGSGLIAAERGARRALQINGNQLYARLTETVLQRPMLDLASNEDQLTEIRKLAPDNITVMRHLWNLYQSVGLSRRASRLVERAVTLEPLAPVTNYPHAQLLWIRGRNAEADRVIDRAMDLWPAHPWVRFARFMIYAFTDRPRAALGMLDDDKTRPQSFTPQGVALWRVSLSALDQRSPARIAAARDANLEVARENPALSGQSIMTLATLGDTDAAFEVANALLLFRDPVASSGKSGAALPGVRSTAWRFTPWLFTPPAAALRADSRFNALCDGIGLTDYWNKRRVRPDYQLGIT